MSTNHDAVNQSTHSKHYRKWLLLILTGFFLLLGISFSLYWLWVGRFYESTDDAYVNGNTIQVMSQISGQVIEILADVTNKVNKGEPLILLDKTDAEIALNDAKAKLALSARQVNRIYHDIEQLKTAVLVAQDNNDRAQDDLKRRQGLAINKTISIEDLRHAQNTANNTKDALTLAKQQLQTAITLVGKTNLYQHPQIKEAENKLRNAYFNLRRTTIYSPDSGLIAKRAVQVGQEITPSTMLMIIVPLDQIWVEANFKESQFNNIRIGQKAKVISDYYGSKVKYDGIVIGLNPGTGSSFDLLPAQNATGNWIKIVQRLPVRIAINSKQLEKYPLRIGLSTKVTIDTHDRKGLLTQVSERKTNYQTKNFSSDLNEADEMITTILKENAPNSFYSADEQKSE